MSTVFAVEGKRYINERFENVTAALERVAELVRGEFGEVSLQVYTLPWGIERAEPVVSGTLDAVVESGRRVVDAAATLAPVEVPPAAPSETVTERAAPVATDTVEYSQEQVVAAFRAWVAAHSVLEAKALLDTFGAARITDLPGHRYHEFMARVSA